MLQNCKGGHKKTHSHCEKRNLIDNHEMCDRSAEEKRPVYEVEMQLLINLSCKEELCQECRVSQDKVPGAHLIYIVISCYEMVTKCFF